MPTLKEVPANAEIPSHQLLLRAGMIRRLVSGIYTYLPLGYRVIRKVEQITREEMDAAGSQEFLLSALQPRELWEASGRWKDFGPEMFKLYDRNEREFCLGPTHEEYFTSVIKGEVNSYKQLPLNIYQIQTKYRDEKRPRFGLMRGREFIMKDAYSFDVDEKGLEIQYQNMWDAYDKIYTRLNLDYKVVQGDTGAMGGKVSHEFMAMSDVGEGLLVYCDDCDYAATDEKAEVIYEVSHEGEEILEMERVHTPNVTTIEDLNKFMSMDKSKFGKALVYNAAGTPVVAIIPADRDLNEVKLINYLGIGEHELEFADEATVMRITGANTGFTGPVGLNKEARLLVDSRMTKMKNIVVGGNETDYHIKNVNYGRDFEGEVVDDLLLVEDGDTCPECGKSLMIARGIEVGNIFQLGTKYSESIGAKFLDVNGKEQFFVMGSYGVGVTRSVSAIVEQHHDDDGIIWPLSVAPYHVIITVINPNNEEQMGLAEKLYDELQSLGYEVLFDERDERAGVKFKDRDLIGIPIRVTVGKRAGENVVEYSLRETKENSDVDADAVKDLVLEEFKKQGLK